MTHIITYLRFLSRHKTLSIINIFGLSLGFAACIFIGLYVSEELGYDRYHEKADRIFAITTEVISPESTTKLSTAPRALAPKLKQISPEVEEAVRLETTDNLAVRYGDKVFRGDKFFYSDPQVFRVFTWPLLQGDSETALSAPGSMVVTETLGRKYFGQDNPMGKALRINDREYQVTGVMEDLPTATDVPFSGLLSFDTHHEAGWFDFDAYTYVLLNESFMQSDPSITPFLEKLENVEKEDFKELTEHSELRIGLPSEPLAGVHFREPYYDDTPKGNIQFIYIISSVALLLLLIGSLNFINFSLVQSLERGREVGIRKIVGASFQQLVIKYLSESVFTTLLAFVFALLLVSAFMPLFNDVADKSFGLEKLFTLRFFGVAIAIVLVVGILAGSFPAFFTSSIRPLQSLKGKITGLRGLWFRKASILIQFGIAIGLIICTLLINRQMNFISSYDLGFRKDNIIVIDTPTDSVATRGVKVLKQALLQQNGVENVTALGYGTLPGTDPMKGTLSVKAGGETKVVNILSVDEAYVPTLGIKLLEGRNFDSTRPADKGRSVIVNEAFAATWGWKDPLQQKVLFDEEAEVIGLMKDFHFSSLQEAIEPTVLVFGDGVADNMLVRFHSDLPVAEQMAMLETEWVRVFPNEPFAAHFFDESLAAQYLQEERTFTLFTSFSVLTIVVSCLGLFGLCSLTISQRKREVGIRKIVGAGFGSIISLFSKEYLLLILLSFILVAPLSLWGITRWLASFPFRDSISAWVFAVAGLGVMGLGIFTIVLSIRKTWGTNPAALIRE